MAEDRDALARSAAWQELFPALRLFAALRLALGFRALVLAAAGLVVMTGRLVGLRARSFPARPTRALQAQMKGNDVWPWQEAIVQPPPAAQPPGESDGSPEATLEIPVGSLTTLEGWSREPAADGLAAKSPGRSGRCTTTGITFAALHLSVDCARCGAWRCGRSLAARSRGRRRSRFAQR